MQIDKLPAIEFMVSAPTLGEDIARRLRLLIHSGALSPGDRLPSERELSQQLEVGRVSVREAVRILQAMGYIEVRRGATGGSFVSELTRPYEDWVGQLKAREADIDEIVDLRIGLEMRTASLAAVRRTDRHLLELLESIEQLGVSGSRGSFRACDARFHGGIARAAGNSRLEAAVVEARGEMFVPVDHLVFEDQVEASRVEHKEIFEAIKRGDSARAAEAMERHILHAKDELKRLALQEEG
ncbi:FadR/GntR family transcriptional regulator [Rhodococcus qingshengii]|uniref:DNA-binding transcriptional regulator, FadR family n=6 Tax=Actinomycetes TaxID=1760 RepID=A0A5P3GGR8_RHOER|nr:MULTISPECIES: FadR/GntR family transcriptional regulator [Rhodococcus]ERB55970.1 hypothetical protein N806_33200 [Rhodococcus sp. P27]NHE64170.1 FadR family transcriptional regulator [Rhodococcus sp. D-46]OCC17356.1 hypothetical protein AS590_01485 [Prescottella equi]ANQ71191.1 hypothetical protein AOT96_10205 [Rhodococcus sp. 008]ARE36864.1 hypothetical protein A0W34_28910 [Rhodococcus sp. BH4]